jgi:hypothetical protein
MRSVARESTPAPHGRGKGKAACEKKKDNNDGLLGMALL